MGELADVIARAATIAADPLAPIYRAALAAAHVQAGALDEARPIFVELAADLDAFHPYLAWSTTMALLTETALVLHDSDAAAQLYDRLAPYADQTSGINELTCEGSIAHRLGCVAALLGRTDDAIEHLTAALAANRRLESPIHVAATAHELARLLTDRNPTLARDLYAEAEQLIAECNLDAWPGITGRWSP
jgi:tetratricopeptide (TPR) repeat protein